MIPNPSPSCLSALQIVALGLAVAASLHGQKPATILAPARGPRAASAARHTAFYLAHVAGGLSVTDTAALLRRSRRAVRHGCARLEDARDDASWDRTLGTLECGLAAQRTLCDFWTRSAGAVQ